MINLFYFSGNKIERSISKQVLAPYNNNHHKIYIRFCKWDNKKNEQLDCLPKCFVLTINNESVQIKTKYSANPYDISRLLHDKKSSILFRIDLTDVMEQIMNFHYGIVVVKKVDLRYLINDLPRTPSDIMSTINNGLF